MSHPLMPHATACWLIENTGLTFPQIAEFCGLHMLEVQAIADDTASIKYTPRDPVRAHELTQDEIKKGEANADYALKISKTNEPVRRTKGPRYTPVSKRQDKPDGIAWILRNHPEISDGAIGRLRKGMPLGVDILRIVRGNDDIDDAVPEGCDHRLPVFLGS